MRGDLLSTLADQIGLDVYGLGEHHREEFVSSAPEVILAAAASRTKNIRLTSAVTVLSSDDPVRVFQRFATLDLVSNGRAEIIAGRGSLIESFPLFGYDLHDYDDLFSEKLDLLLKIRENEKVTWRSQHRAPIDNLGVYPRPVQEKLPIWVGVGGTPESVVRAASRGLPMALAIIGGMPTAFDDEREQIVYEMATVLSGARWVPRGLYQRAVNALGHVGITDVITLMGHYSSVAMTLAFYDVPDGATGIQR